jgi:glycosyltransferase involved in cell wall biosynthesis
MLIGIDSSRATLSCSTGTEFYSVRLIKALLALNTPHRFRLYFNKPPLTGLFGTGYDSSRVEMRRIAIPRLWTHIGLSLEVASHPPDVLFVPSHVLPLWTRVPAVVTVHDLGYVYFPRAHPGRQRWYLDWSTRHNARTARVVIADSAVTKGDLMAHYAVEATKIIVAHPGFDEDLSPVTDQAVIDAAKRRYGIEGDYFVHIGTLQPRKNLARLIRAFGKLPSENQVQLVLAGKRGWLYDDLFRQVQSMGLERRVLFPGYVDAEDKAALLSGAVAYVFPSLYEGFGFPALEAQACDTPLICANSSSLPEVAGNGALLIDAAEVEGLTRAMMDLLVDANLRADLTARGQRNLRRFSWRACAETVIEALEQAVNSRRTTNDDGQKARQSANHNPRHMGDA